MFYCFTQAATWFVIMSSTICTKLSTKHATDALCETLITNNVVTLGSLWDHFGVTLGSLWDHFGVTLGSLLDHFGVILGWTGQPGWLAWRLSPD